ncbi:2-C-methyl-D-erythritol 4-phosphate cytidylyltransferase [Sodalis glossinidius str. 'morsitans']|uniref:2-C-methyl-D-erythritol 4-phosphate cytidylyltransferase n=2 Tax=Sodalis glossinidius (strain morsitans) TaxID=343509 RepID=ISPD_SODGM|nr:2-C-methyl-D-erythritol 4-phosphate cytidylyltransferase [Sodalis glossinidius]Q2NVM4.1 RecName: Full=2-C-methyl-D-erythritol 4-phosphate cytidylyltransferase; AltName: Full=4-diphosphocytidyl-2C-methyl-D-erythritol synthase; AltName: Full=MEP cytidylyltransferase; Short=MCT [Sodalis glossinidius str. 'morsitans']BAE73801.1 2-C-methyl-D-erythritol 4-phosphate cytidylyltransferase [Sodalis glossinidius str. 'morsitans']CRL44243.1 2-C-methyl-D-erythritol 4-phosphate cytidylyltransferase [Sodali
MIALAGQTPDVIAILPAAGIGSRMQTALPKQYLTIGNKTLLEHAIDALLCHPCISEAVVAISAEDRWFYQLPVAADPRVRVVTGGSVRADSVMAALRCASAASWVLVHDAARPCLHQDDLRRLLVITAHTEVGGLLATPVRDTMKRAHTGSDIIAATVEREDLWHALTPQLFARDLLITCLERALAEGATVTDEASALEYCGYAPLLVPGRVDNIKVTRPEDLALARFFFSQLANTESV